MSKDFYFLFVLIAIGLLTRRLTWRGWFVVVLCIAAFIMHTWKRGN